MFFARRIKDSHLKYLQYVQGKALDFKCIISFYEMFIILCVECVGLIEEV